MLGTLNRSAFLKASRISLANNSQSSSKNFIRTELPILGPQHVTKMIPFRGKAKERIAFSVLQVLPAFTLLYFIHANP